MNTIIGSIVRHLLTSAGGALAAHGYAVSNSDVETIAGGLLAIGGVVWSIWQKRSKPM